MSTVIRSVLGGFCLLLVTTRASWAKGPLEDDVLPGKILPAMVKIDLNFRDSRKRVLHTVHGQGVRISPSGHILTAMHVVLPYANELIDAHHAVSYDMRISDFVWSPRASYYEALPIPLPRDILSISLYDKTLGNDFIRPCSASVAQPCLVARVDEKRDFVVINTNRPALHFVDVIGPLDIAFAKGRLDLGIVSDFDEPDSPQFSPAESSNFSITNGMDSVALRSQDRAPIFEKGVSGSPFIAWKDASRGRRGVFVLGIVSTNRPGDSNLDRGSVALLGPNFRKWVIDVMEHDDSFIAPSVEPWNCRVDNADYPRSTTLLRDYLMIKRLGRSGLEAFPDAIECGEAVAGWETSFFSLRIADQVRELAGLSQFQCTRDDSCRIGDGAAVGDYEDEARQLGVSQASVDLEWKRFESLGGSVIHTSGINGGGSMPVGSGAAMDSYRRIQRLSTDLYRQKERVAHARAERLLVEIVDAAHVRGMDAGKFLADESLAGPYTQESRESLEATVRAVEAGKAVQGIGARANARLAAYASGRPARADAIDPVREFVVAIPATSPEPGSRRFAASGGTVEANPDESTTAADGLSNPWQRMETTASDGLGEAASADAEASSEGDERDSATREHSGQADDAGTQAAEDDGD